jgi:hypothetical protein
MWPRSASNFSSSCLNFLSPGIKGMYHHTQLDSKDILYFYNNNEQDCFIRLFLGGGLVLTKQALYCLSHTSSSFCSGYFGDGVSPSICCPWTMALLSSASQVARIISVSPLVSGPPDSFNYLRYRNEMIKNFLWHHPIGKFPLTFHALNWPVLSIQMIMHIIFMILLLSL